MIRTFMRIPTPVRKQKVNDGASPGGDGSNESEHATEVVGMAVGAFEKKVGGVTQSVGAASSGGKPPAPPKPENGKGKGG